MSGIKRSNSNENIDTNNTDNANTNNNKRNLKKFKKSNEPLDTLSEYGQLTQDDVVFFQKEAIYRLLNQFRYKNKILNNQLKLVSSNFSKSCKIISVLNTWWLQIIENFENLKDINLDEFNNELKEKILLNFNILDKDKEEFNDEILKSLKLKRNLLIDQLLPVFLNSNNNSLSDNETKLIILEESIADLNSLKLQLEFENKSLKNQVESLNLELDNLIKLNDRSSSKTLKRIRASELTSDDQSNDVNSNNTPTGETDNNTRSATTTTDSNSQQSTSSVKLESSETLLPSGSSSTTTNVNNTIEIEDLKLKINELETKNSSLTDTLEKNESQIKSLDTEILNLKNKLLNLSDIDLSKSLVYQNLLSQNSTLTTELNESKYESKKLKESLSNLESNLTHNQQELESKLKQELLTSNNYIEKLESDLNRIRSDRDELNSRLSILKNEKGKSELIEEFKKLNSIYEKKLLDSENNLKTNLNNDVENSTNKILINELKQLEEAFKETRNIANSKLSKYYESDSLINKLSIEKDKADEKYFSAMRAKDALHSENKILTTNMSKQSELINNLKSIEKELRKKCDLLEKELNIKLTSIQTKLETDYSYQISKNKELDIKSKTLSTQNNDLVLRINELTTLLNNSNSKLKTLELNYNNSSSKIKSLEKLITKYRTNNPNSSISLSNSSSSSANEEEEIKSALLSMTKCSLCNKNFKNVALKTCGHTFCSECTTDRLNSRMRKCPNCNKQFSRYDLLTIHL
ncbi:unnamed protein product [[Candida] boidinii]|uniref:E3 ubiquitin protein ligase n=1 Tax=Candida boidinii TaxID=5477 RepID=A0A9W6WHI6_CANBO|nr:binding protein [[Candida] boidinii]GME73235.1 unnamed protein product [[Candida] boidinii]